MRKRISYIILIFSLVQYGCDRSQKRQSILDQNTPKIVEARGYTVPSDSMAEPRVVPAGKPTVMVAGKPKVVLTNTNVHPAGIPRIVKVSIPWVCTPGQDGFSLPKTVPAIDSPFIAGIPEVVTAKEAYTKEQNPQNFASFGKLQGLKSNEIKTLLEDKKGNLWIGAFGGLSKYDGKSFTQFTDKEGLINNNIISILEDKSGNLWVGTYSGGVSKYDGKSFTNFTVKEGLNNNNVNCILEDKSGNLWLGTDGGLSKYDGKSFTHFTVKEGLNSNDTRCLLEDKNGNIWIGTGEGMNKWDGKSFTRFDGNDFARFTQTEDNNWVSSILEDKKGDLWFGTRKGGVIKFDGKSFTQFTDNEGLSDNNVISIREDEGGNLWFGTFRGGVSKYDGKRFTHFTDKEGLSDNDVRTILEDRSGGLWFGTYRGGVSRYDGNKFTHFTIKEGLSDNRTSSILEDKRGNLWFGGSEFGISKYDGKSFTCFTDKDGMHRASISTREDKSGNLWFGDWSGVSKYDGKTFTHFFAEKEVYVESILEDKSGNLWFGTCGSGVIKFDGKSFTHFTVKQGLSNNIVLSSLEDKGGNLWFGTYGGLSKYDGKSFIHFTERGGLINNKVLSCLEDKTGNLWFGTAGGLSKYDGKSFTNFTEKEGLSNNSVRSILEDKIGNLWLGTDVGFSKLEKDKLSSLTNVSADEADSILSDPRPLFKTYTYEDGYSGIDVNGGKTIYEAKDGTIWIGANDRLTAFHPGAETPNTLAPNIQLTGITLFNETIAWQNLITAPGRGRLNADNFREGNKDTSIVLGNGVSLHDFNFNGLSKWYGVPERLNLPYNNNYLTFQFVGITMKSPKKVKYQYILEGLDKNWSALTNRTEASYGNLPHGKYTFKVKAMNGDGYWSKEFNYSFTIRPPWWRTWWAYTLFALLFAGFIYAFFRYRLNKIRMQHEIVLQQHKASELEMQALRAQMNPHFIFNSLNSINMFILENNKLQASEYLSKFSRLVRLILQNSQEALIPLERELEALQLYLELESLRFEQRFEYKISTGDEVDTTVLKVPPLMVQPYVENAIWHGLMHKKERGRIEIELYQEEEILFCKVTDDGVGRKTAAELKSKSASTYKSVGMGITASRIALLQQRKQNEASISINDLVLPNGGPGGTEVLIKIPLYYD